MTALEGFELTLEETQAVLRAIRLRINALDNYLAEGCELSANLTEELKLLRGVEEVLCE